MDGAQFQDLIIELSERHAASGGPARAVLGAVFPELDLSPAERHAVSRAFYQMHRWRRRIDFALALATRRAPQARERTLTKFVASLVLDGAITPAEADARLRDTTARIDWAKVADLDATIALDPDPVRRFGVGHSIPDWLAERFLAEFDADADAVMAGLNQPPPLTVRTNTLRTDRAALQTALATLGLRTMPTRFAPHGLVLDGEVNLFATQPFQDGWFEQQDEASQLCAHLVAPPPGGTVLDACAGSGGKTLALAAALQNRGAILATDIHARKLAELVARRRRAGTDNVRSLAVAEDAWPEEVEAFARRADRILLDVPCDGVGAWRRRPDARWHLDPTHVEGVAARQRALLARTVACLKPGARLVYATCTIFRNANEEVVEGALAADAELELVPLAEILGGAAAAPVARGPYLATLPHTHGTDGFFAAVLRRKRRGRGPSAQRPVAAG